MAGDSPAVSKKKKIPGEAKLVLNQFLQLDSREVEESFCRLLTGKHDVRLFFILENCAYTDGRQIVVDPSIDQLFYDQPALDQVENALKLDLSLASDPWLALRIITRSQSCHEALHILLTRFPAFTEEHYKDRAKTKCHKMILHLLHNIVEDAFIEAAGAKMFDNIARYLMFGRYARLFASAPGAGTVEDAFGPMKAALVSAEGAGKDEVPGSAELKDEAKRHRRETLVRLELISCFLERTLLRLLYPVTDVTTPEQLRLICEKTDPLLEKASRAPTNDERVSLVLEVFDCLKPLLPDIADDEEELLEQLEQRFVLIHFVIGASKETHDLAAGGSLINEPVSHNFVDPVEKDLFEYTLNVHAFDDDKEELELLRALIFVPGTPSSRKNQSLIPEHAVIPPGTLGSVLHVDIPVIVEHPKPDERHRLKYKEITGATRGLIGRMRRRFREMLVEPQSREEPRQLFGGRIVSKDLGRADGRIWERNIPVDAIIPLSVFLLVDGSGSMSGERIDAARKASVLLYEILHDAGFPFACAEHRSNGFALQINLMVDFSDPDPYKLNLLTLRGDWCNRDGLALAWSNRYLKEHAPCGRMLLIVICDGMPDDLNYYGEEAVLDTRAEVRRIEKTDTTVIAIALDRAGSTECYDQVRQIYRYTIGCDDLSQLPRHLLRVIARQIGS
jgi:uncharacterized protein YegL